MADNKFIEPAAGAVIYAKKGIKVSVYPDRLTITPVSGTMRSLGEALGAYVGRISTNDSGEYVFVVSWTEAGRTRTGWVKEKEVTWAGKESTATTSGNTIGTNIITNNQGTSDTPPAQTAGQTNTMLMVVFGAIIFLKFVLPKLRN